MKAHPARLQQGGGPGASLSVSSPAPETSALEGWTDCTSQTSPGDAGPLGSKSLDAAVPGNFLMLLPVKYNKARKS